MQHLKYAAYGFAVGAMLVFLPLAGKLNTAKDQEIQRKILMDVSCTMTQEEFEEKLSTVEIPEDIGMIKEGQNKVLWDKAKQSLIEQCYG